MMRRKLEEIQYQNTVKEYRKFYTYTNNLNKEYQPINVNVLDVNCYLKRKK